MSKMSQLHAELSEQAADLGYESLGEAEQMGCEVDWENRKLIPPEEAAHNSIMEEKEEILSDIASIVRAIQNHQKMGASYVKKLEKITDFIIKEVK